MLSPGWIQMPFPVGLTRLWDCERGLKRGYKYPQDPDLADDLELAGEAAVPTDSVLPISSKLPLAPGGELGLVPGSKVEQEEGPASSTEQGSELQ